MAFYLRAPKGTRSLHTLTEDAVARLNFLHQVHRWSGHPEKVDEALQSFLPSGADFLVEGSLRDYSSHYMLRLAVLQKAQWQRFLVEAETELFQHRLRAGGRLAVVRAVLQLRRQLVHEVQCQHWGEKERQYLEEVLQLVRQVCSRQQVVCVDTACCQHSEPVAWEVVLELVAQRQVVVKRGQAWLHCGHLLPLLAEVFARSLYMGLRVLVRLQVGQDDPRINQLCAEVQAVLRQLLWWRQHSLPTHTLTHTQVQARTHLFPPCMQQLHHTLEKQHRLRNSGRVCYTLFLKEAGMPLEESLAFWEAHYRHPASPHCTCTHQWVGPRATRYMYSIKHLYGQEGRRINYTAHTCARLQTQKAQPQEEGGCPFISSPAEQLRQQLAPVVGTGVLAQWVLAEAQALRPSLACRAVQAAMLCRAQATQTQAKPQLPDLEDILAILPQCDFTSPSQYYLHLSHKL